MKKTRDWILISAVLLLSILVISFDVRSYQAYRKNMIESEQKQLLMMAETVGGSLQYDIEQELQKIDAYFALGADLSQEGIEQAGKEYIRNNNHLFTAVSFEPAEVPVSDARITGKQLADSGWYEMEIQKILPGKDGNTAATFRMDLNEVYKKIVKPVRIGEGGYSVVKDKDLAIIMHHAKNQIGMDAIYDRQEQYPDLDLSSLRDWLKLQTEQPEGVSVIDTYVWDDPDLRPVQRIVAFTTIRIQSEEWIVNSTLPMAELEKPLREMIVFITCLTLLYFILAASALLWISRVRLKEEAQQKEISYLQEINKGMEAVARQNDEIRHYQRIESLGMMASHIAHEFNNYLTPVMVYTELVGDDPGISDESRDMLKETMRSVEKAADLSRELLDFSRQDSGGKLDLIDLREETVESAAMVEKLAPSKISVYTDIMKDPAMVLAREGMMQHILLNLSKNAFQAMEETEKKELHISLQPDSHQFILKVRDTGTGISRDSLTRIFEPFYTTKGSKQGTGLGLSVVRNIIRSVNGTISVESTPGEGTCFTMTFPIAAEKEETEKKEKDRTVFVITDSSHIEEIRKHFPARTGKETEFWEEEMGLLSRIRDDPYYCRRVVADYSLKTMTGVEFLEIIGRLNQEIELVLLTDSIDPDLQWYVNNRIIDRIITRDEVTGETISDSRSDGI